MIRLYAAVTMKRTQADIVSKSRKKKERVHAESLFGCEASSGVHYQYRIRISPLLYNAIYNLNASDGINVQSQRKIHSTPTTKNFFIFLIIQYAPVLF